MRCSIQKPKRKKVDSGKTVGRPQPWRLPRCETYPLQYSVCTPTRSINSPRLTSNHRIYILTAHGDEGWFAVNPPPSPKAPHHHVVNYPLTSQRSRRYRRVHVGLLIWHHRCLFTTNFCAPEKVVGEESHPFPHDQHRRDDLLPRDGLCTPLRWCGALTHRAATPHLSSNAA